MDPQKLILVLEEQRNNALANCATLELHLRFARERIAELEAAERERVEASAPAPLHIVEPKPAA